MQQMAGHMNLLSPFVFNQFGPYNAYAQTQQQAALMAAAQGTYMNPMAALATQIPHALGGKLKKSWARQCISRGKSFEEPLTCIKSYWELTAHSWSPAFSFDVMIGSPASFPTPTGSSLPVASGVCWIHGTFVLLSSRAWWNSAHQICRIIPSTNHSFHFSFSISMIKIINKSHCCVSTPLTLNTVKGNLLMQHLYPRPLCQHSTWLKHQTVNQLEPKLFIQTEYLIRILDVREPWVAR